MKLREITSAIESFAPLSFQESYDNAGLITGDPEMEISSAIVCLDVTEKILQEATESGANLVISHHPILFHPLKSLTGKNYVEKIVMKAIRNDIAIYAAHTNLDSVSGGINFGIAGKIGLKNVEILDPQSNNMVKIVVYTPESHADKVIDALSEAGAGQIGNYDSCTFNTAGTGTFRARPGATPFTGKIGELHREAEIRTEAIAPNHLVGSIISAVRKIHPYEEMAYDVYPMLLKNPTVGSGIIGELEQPEKSEVFLNRIKEIFKTGVIRHSHPPKKEIKRVALCGGSGSFLMPKAISKGADAFLTADIKYDTFFAAEREILLADIGHFESEYCAIDILYDIVTKKLPNFAVRKSGFLHNPIIYLA